MTDPKDPSSPDKPTADPGGDKPASAPAAPPAAAAPATPAVPAAAAPAPAAAAPAPAAAASPAAAVAPAAAAKPAAPAAAKPAAAAKAPAPPAHDMKPAPPSGPTDPPPPAGTAVPAFITALEAAVPGSVELVSYWVGDWSVIVPVAKLLEAAQFLRDSPEFRFDFCSDVTASDWPPRAKRFDVIYCLYSTRHHTRLRLKVHVGENDPVPSVCALWPAANWLEREVYDLFGVNFTGHPDRRRILMPDDWQGFPQRKDYPLEGPGELLMESPLDWLKLKQAREEADIE